MSLQLEIYTPERKVFGGEVNGIQLPGLDGLFEVLSHHASLVSAIVGGKMKVMHEKEDNSYYKIKGGFIEVLNNHATVLVEGAIPFPGTEKE